MLAWKLETGSSGLQLPTKTACKSRCRSEHSTASTKSNFPISVLCACLGFCSLCPILTQSALQSVSGQYFMLVHEILSIHFFFPKYQTSNHMSAPLTTNSYILPSPPPFSSFFPWQLKKVKSKTKQINVYRFVISFFLFIYLFPL